MINHNGYMKNCNKAAAAVQPYLDYCILCDSKPNDAYYTITLAVDPEIKGVRITVSEADGENQSIEIKGQDEAHLFYAVCDFKAKYIPFAKTNNVPYRRWKYPKIFKLPVYHYESAPKIKQRGIWTWGHVIYDYCRFIDYMAELKMNTLTVSPRLL